jgi:hypothetical protein
MSWWTVLLTALALTSAAGAFLALTSAAWKNPDPTARVVAASMLATSAAVVLGFLINRNIFNSDNYRYLVLLLVSWSVGFGLAIQQALRAGSETRWTILGAAAVLAVLFTYDAGAWYRRLGWIDERFHPVHPRLVDPAADWLADHPEIRSIYGGYWDVYRLSFLSAGRLRGVPFPIFPNRFPEWTVGLPGGRPETLLVRRSPEGQLFLNTALREGAKVLYGQGEVAILHWPSPRPGGSR